MTTNIQHLEDKLPTGWEWVRLGDVIDSIQPGFACGVRADNGVIQIRMNNVTTNGTFVWDDLTRIPNDYKNMTKYWLETDDVLFNNTNSAELVGKSAIFSEFEEGIVYSNHFSRIRTNRKILEPSFLLRWLVSKWQDGTFQRMCNRWVGQASVPRKQLIEIFLPIPQLDEQKRIVDMLNEQMADVDKAKKAAEESLEAANSLHAAYLRDAFPSNKDGLPVGWKWIKLGDVAEVTSSKRVFESQWQSEGIPFYRARNLVQIHKNGLADNDIFISNDLYEEISKKYVIPEKGDILVTAVGTLGVTYVVKGDDKLYFKDGNIICVKPSEEIDTNYLNHIFSSPLMRIQIENTVGTTVKTLTIVRAKDLHFPLPPIEEQKRIAAVLNEQITGASLAEQSIQQELDSIEAMPASLLRKAFKGKL